MCRATIEHCLIAAFMGGVLLGTPLGTLAAEPAKAGPSATSKPVERPGLGEIETADYCTVLLAPKLRTFLGANDAQRETLEQLNTELKGRLDNCTNAHMPGLNPNMITAGTISARMKRQLAEFGRKVRDALTPEQDRRLVDMFNDNTLKHVDAAVSVDVSSPRFGPNAGKVYRTTSYAIIYTHYGEEGATSHSGPLPKATDAPTQPDASSHKPRHPRGQPEQEAQTVSVNPSDQMELVKLMQFPVGKPVHHLARTIDGKLLITAEDKNIRLWDCTSLPPRAVAVIDSEETHIRDVRAISISPDGSLLGIGSEDKTVRLYSLAAGTFKKMDLQMGHDRGLFAVAFSPDGKSLISSADDQNVVWWNIDGGRLTEKSRIKLKSMFGIKYLAVQPNKTVTCTSGSGDVFVLDFAASSPTILKSYKIHSAHFVLPMAMNPADSTLAFGSGHDLHLGEKPFTSGTKDIKAVAWSQDGKYLAVGTDDGHLSVWDRTGKLRYDYTRSNRFNDVAFVSDGSPDVIAVGANDDGEVYMLRLKAAKGL